MVVGISIGAIVVAAVDAVDVVAIVASIVASAFVGFAAVGAIDGRMVVVLASVGAMNGIGCDGVSPQHLPSLLLGIVRVHSLVKWMFQFPFLYPLLKALVPFEDSIVGTARRFRRVVSSGWKAIAACACFVAVAKRYKGLLGNGTHRFVVVVSIQPLQYGPPLKGMPTSVLNGVFHDLQGQWTNIIRRNALERKKGR